MQPNETNLLLNCPPASVLKEIVSVSPGEGRRPICIFNQRLSNYFQKFPLVLDYIFFAHSFIQRLQLHGQMNIAMRKVLSDSMITVMLSQNFKETLKQFIATNKVCSFISSFKDTLHLKCKHEVLVTVKQPGISTFFLICHFVDLKWDEVNSVLFKNKQIKYISREN